jgi:predicted TIM-barrel fold metal-dependent hydrolase
MAKFSKQGFPFDDTKPYVDALFAAFGEDRVLWGSDWPFLLAPQRMDYGTLLLLAEQWFPDPNVREKYFWRNAARLFGFS